MIGYSLVGSNNVPRAKAFFDDVLSHLGAKRVMEWGDMVHWGTGGFGAGGVGVTKPYDGKAANVGNGSMVALVADSRAKVDAVHATALRLGGTDEGAPGLRGPEGDQAFYGAYFRDLDGNKFCVFRMGPK